ncbi:CHRD domain-containing protein [Erythrobacter sp. F6033]|uniref:CHRD domain-containing protein n=1 Tax=Erythrobacter sp. F6033 TaxID=2926401 RepID=UPI001FF14ADE|nr:CHRD domain-containing protein [Erythrobacter sp. F6033]MCK0128055.1 CHRD domain-containing protein [Erythrobacter sp. F6033]
MTHTAKWIAAALCAGSIAAAPVYAQSEYAYIGASLFGEHEVGHEGAGEDASGDFSAELNLQTGSMCYMLEVEGLDDFAAAHIHKGEAGKNGPPVVTLELTDDDKCIDVDVELLKDMAKNERKYYVNVHTAAFPEGAIRGQLK